MTPLIHRDRPTYVYLLTNEHGEVIYVGVSNNLKGRRASHRHNWWWDDVADWRIVGPFLDRERAEIAERAYIARYCPMFNTQGVPRGRLYELTRTEVALVRAWREYKHCLRSGQIKQGSEREVASLLSRIDRLRQTRRRERLTLLQGGAA